MLKKHCTWFLTRIEEDRLDSTAAHGAYFIIIAFLPFVAFLLTLFQQINVESGPLMSEILSTFPESVAVYIEGLLAERFPSSSIMSVSIITFLWAASNGMVAIIKGLDAVYQIKESRNFIHLRLVAMGYLVAFSITLAITSITLVFGNTIYNKLLSESPPFFATILVRSKSLLGFFLLMVFFCLIFNAIPRKQAKFKHNLMGAMFSAAGWVLFSFFFSIFVDNFSNYSVIYGSLATLVVLMFWLYTCMYIMFLGAEVAMWLEHSGIQEDMKEFTGRLRSSLGQRKGSKSAEDSKGNHKNSQQSGQPDSGKEEG